MTEIQALYQQVILDHNKNPHNFGELDHADCSAEGLNPLCGDHINVFLNLDGNIISDIRFNGSGCAISKSSASIMTTLLKGKTIKEAEELFGKFHDLVTADFEEEYDEDDFGKLAVFAGVREFPARIKCASLAWHTLKSALDGNSIISTE